jgi:hypothetical protein
MELIQTDPIGGIQVISSRRCMKLTNTREDEPTKRWAELPRNFWSWK